MNFITSTNMFSFNKNVWNSFLSSQFSQIRLNGGTIFHCVQIDVIKGNFEGIEEVLGLITITIQKLFE
jgi:hypothetical protein